MIKKIGLIVVGLVVVLLVAVQFFLGPIIKTALETAGPKVAGVSFAVQKVRVNPLAGAIYIKGLVIGNPEGFKTASAMELGKLDIDLKMTSLFSDTIMVKKIHIDGPQVTYEKALRSSNLSTLQDNLSSDQPKKAAKDEVEEAPAQDEGPAKKVVIEDFIFENAKVNVSLTVAGGKQLTLPIPTIHLQDIGKSSGGTSPAEVVREVLDAIIQSAGTAVSSSKDAIKEASSAAKDAAKAAAKDAAKGVTDSAAGAAKGASDAASGALKGATKGFGKFLGK